jgi:hypothetical protein
MEKKSTFNELADIGVAVPRKAAIASFALWGVFGAVVFKIGQRSGFKKALR